MSRFSPLWGWGPCPSVSGEGSCLEPWPWATSPFPSAGDGAHLPHGGREAGGVGGVGRCGAAPRRSLGDGAVMLPHLRFPGSLPFRGDMPELPTVAEHPVSGSAVPRLGRDPSAGWAVRRCCPCPRRGERLPDSSSGRSGASNEPRGRPGCPAFPSLPSPLLLLSKNGRDQPGRRTGAAFLPLSSSSSRPALRLHPRASGRERDSKARRGHHWGELPAGREGCPIPASPLPDGVPVPL